MSCWRALPVAAALALAQVSAHAASDGPAELAVVYVESNVGTASGGHAALRIGERLYNFQFDSSGLLKLLREDWEAVQFRYGVLENRPIHVAQLRLSAEDRARVRDHFDRVYLTQQRDLGRLRDAEDDVGVLEALAGLRSGVDVRGAGLLDPARRAAPPAVALRARIAAERGTDFLARARERVAAELAALPLLDAAGRPLPEPLRRARELLAEQTALLALDEGFDVAPEALLPADEAAELTSAERAALADFAAELEATLLALLSSPRPDRGFPLLVAAARRLALLRSLEEGRLRLLDPLPDAAPALDADEVARHREEVVAAAAAVEREWPALRGRLLRPPLDEPRYNRLEELAGRRVELAAAAASRRPLRLPCGPLVPARARRVALSRSEPVTAFAGAVSAARFSAGAERTRVAERHVYQIVMANCVTAIADGLADAFGGEAGLRAALGADAPGGGLGFVPFVFFDQVRDAGAVASVERLPSLRERGLAALYRSGSRARLYAREANTLTSTLYRRRDRDGSFLLFTDDVFWPRPVYGALNLAYALGDGVIGVASAPFDRGRRVVRAARGAFFSLPELAFLNIRKGSFDAASLAEIARPRPTAAAAQRGAAERSSQDQSQ